MNMMTIIEKARYLRAKIEALAETLTDEEGLEFIPLFKNWLTNTQYAVGERVKYDDVLYKCVQAHTSQDDWTPDITPALWVVVSVEEWPEWVQPIGSQDAYMQGDKVSHNEKHWISLVDNNVWEPSESVPTLWEEAE